MAICSMPKKIEPFFSLGDHEFHYLNSEKSLTKKMYMMEDMLSMSIDEQIEREKIVTDIFNLLRPYYPECDVLIFGSSANGFGFTGCDLDLLFLPFPEYCNLDFKDKGDGVVPTPYHVLKNKAKQNKLYQMDEEMHLKFVQRVMYTTKRYFKKVFFVPAKCPILNIEFVSSPLHCDLSASNRFVLHNTQLLFVYGNLDNCVKPLLKFLRFWAKSLGFISKSLLSSYCLSLLVVFYLQNIHPPVLPSVRYLNEISGYSRIIDGWETAICLDPELINARRRSENPRSLSDLLIQFFDFYWDFDFIQNVVSVYEGEPLPVRQLKESNDERIRTFQVTPFSVQDPFILSRNVSRNTTMKTPFKLSLIIAKDLLCKRNFDFRLLFDSSYYQNEINAIFAPTKSILPPGSMFLTFQLTYDLYNKLAITSHLYPWFDKVCQSMLDILQYGLLFECEVIDKIESVEPPTKKRKFNINNMGNMKFIVSIQCVANFPTFYKRSRVEVLEHLKKTGADFEVEDSEVIIPDSLKTDYKVSKELSKDEIKSVIKLPEILLPPPYFSFVCDFFHYPDTQLSDVLISIAPLTNRKIYNDVKEFLRPFVLKHMKSILQEIY